MKKYLLVYIVALCTLIGCKDNSGLYGLLTDYDLRISELEKLCEDINTNVQSIQVIIEAQQTGDYITAITPIKKDGKVIGYTITFGNHEPITIYNGTDGKDGVNGTNGKDGQDGTDGKNGSTPIIGVAQDTDGVYYWTLNGEWLLDANGNKLPVSGTNGKDGQNGSNGTDGKDGKDGQDGTDGKDGVTPQLEIEDGYWYISYDNGATWTQLGKATGEDGKDGQNGSNGTNGKDGQDGDSMFQSVTQDENYVYFTLADGTVIKIAKGTSTGEDQPNSEFIFTITYDPNGGEGIMEVDTFYYGETKSLSYCSYTKKGHHFAGWNTQANGTGAPYTSTHQMTIEKNIILYAQWKEYEAIDLGLSVLWAAFNIGETSPGADVYSSPTFAWGHVDSEAHTWGTYKYCNGTYNTLTKYCTDNRYGIVDNITTLSPEDDPATVMWGEGWRTPTKEEWEELRAKTSSWENRWSPYGYEISGNGNSIIIQFNQSSTRGCYWTSSLVEDSPCDAYSIYFDIYDGGTFQFNRTNRYSSYPIRPVKDKK